MCLFSNRATAWAAACDQSRAGDAATGSHLQYFRPFCRSQRVPYPAQPELIELSGPDAQAFAQAQFCNDVLALATGESQLNAWLNPQGRVRRLFHLLRIEDTRYLLALRGGTAAPLLAPLKMFVLRLKVQVQALQGWRWQEVDGAAATPAQSWRLALPDARALLLQAPEAPAAPPPPDGDSLLRDIAAGLPWLPEHALEQLLPSWLEFARLGAISHNKGCYPGQEIVARLHFRGGGDKRVLACLASAQAPGGGELRDAEGKEAGLLLQSCALPQGGWRSLAAIRRELAVTGTALNGGDAGTAYVAETPWNG